MVQIHSGGPLFGEEMDKKTIKLGGAGCAAIVVFFFLAVALVAFIGMLAWNAFIPTVFDGPTIDFPTAFAGLILINVILGAARAVVYR